MSGPGWSFRSDRGTSIVAEISGSHNQSFDQAVSLIRAAKDAGADAVKLQTYTADTLTIDCANEFFQIRSGTIWDGTTLYQLYKSAFTPWEWQPKLKSVAEELSIALFSSPFDPTAVDFLETMNVPAYKIASFEIVDIPLIQKIAGTGKPVIMSTGMATLEEVSEAVVAARAGGCRDLILLKCTSGYPSTPEEMNLRTIPDMAARFKVPVGLSDHTLGIVVPLAAVALGAVLIEKHICLSRSDPGPDSAFSLEPHEFKAMVEGVRTAEKALGTTRYEPTENEKPSRVFRRSLFVVADMKEGECFSEMNVRSIRPGHGLAPKLLGQVVGRRAACDIPRGTPLSWEFIL